MKAMVLNTPGSNLELKKISRPAPSAGQVLIEVSVCGVCRTDLHIMDGELSNPKLPLVPGHQIVGTIAETGKNVEEFKPGDHVGVPWLGKTCGECSFCKSGKENLCDHAQFTGYDLNGGFAEYTVADAQYCFPIPGEYPDRQAAPLLCAGLIGYRSLRKAGDARRIGFYGFGSSAHILCQVALHQNREVFAFTRPGDSRGQEFARKLGVTWAGGSDTMPPVKLDAAIIFAPVGSLVPRALQVIKKGGAVICAGIHMSNIPSFEYDLLWGERRLESVANLSRQDGEEFLQLAPEVPVETTVTDYPLVKANEALKDLKKGNFEGSAVLNIK